MSYQKDLERHLAGFKRLHLGIAEAGEFKYRGRIVFHDHILPKRHAWANVFEEARPGVTAFLAKHPRKRHQYFHHLNSSQAFAFNLFFPYFSSRTDASGALLRALGQEGTVSDWEPEAVPAREEETNIDVTWTTNDGVRTFCEVKLSEADFGKAKNDQRHLDKLTGIYSPVLVRHLDASRLEQRAFFHGYQFYRNVWHMARNEGSRLVFLLPRANTGLWNQLDLLLEGVTLQTRHRISATAVEDVIARLLAEERCRPPLREYPNKLKQKYLI